MKTITITQHELNQATRPNVYRNKKKYTRKEKHQGNKNYQNCFVYLRKKVMELVDEKCMVFEQLVNIMNDGLANEEKLTSDVLKELKKKIEELIMSDF